MEGGEWSNFNAAVCVNEEADFMAQLFPNPNDCHMDDQDNGAINNADVDEDQSQLDPAAEDKICDSSYNSKKRGRVLEGVQKGKRSVRVKRSQSLSALGGDDDEKENDGIAVNRQSSSSASRGSATDPQSLYARKRRERINERLKILQSLVPNGTKLLSSDEHWMYAPIAYNGMNIGLDFQFK
uniref:BHLH domain-containing protein n=1 Tax=Chenopodium quinoa TaxID=63459 RepID=A0A803N174_CHEQI